MPARQPKPSLDQTISAASDEEALLDWSPADIIVTKDISGFVFGIRGRGVKWASFWLFVHSWMVGTDAGDGE